MQLTTLNDLFVEQLADLHSAETQLIDALPKLASAASNDELKQAFQHHLEETRDHVRRLDDIIAGLGRAVPTEICEGMRGLIRESEEIVTAGGDPEALHGLSLADPRRDPQGERRRPHVRALRGRIGAQDVDLDPGDPVGGDVVGDRIGVVFQGQLSSRLVGEDELHLLRPRQ